MTMHFLELFLLSLLISSTITTSSSSPDPQLNDDVLGLVVFKSQLHDPLSSLQSWNEDDDSPCSWEFVQCNPSTNRVTRVTLDSLSLSGKIATKGLQKLTSLKTLSLSNNNFTLSPESSPLSLIIHPALEKLNLSRNGFTGQIPSFAPDAACGLKFLDVSWNSFSGQIPDGFFKTCTALRFVSFAGNSLEGSIPGSISLSDSLSHLDLSNNRFSGDFPGFVNGVASLTRLRVLDLSHNALSGVIPNGISVIHNLKELKLQGNRFSGNLPADMGLCPHLSKVDLSDNLFTGSIPSSVGLLNSLSFLSLSNNMFTGDLPNWIGNMSSLEYMDLSKNGFTGDLPFSIGDLKSLNYLSVADNKLSGSIPISLMYSTELSVIRLRGNAFIGSIPEGLFDLGLNEVDFSGNELSGLIPTGSSKLIESLRVLDLSRNKLTGDIPAEMGLLSKLTYLNLSWNGLKSRIPPELGYFQNLTVLDLRNAALFGSIPGDICDSGSLGILQLDGNSLTGSIPQDIGKCSSLYLLSLSYNSLTGSIPKSISMLNNLKILKLESNQLSGEIPQELGNLENLLAVNISYNRLTGRLPVGSIFQTLDQSSFEGNLGICSPLLKGPCKMNSPKPLVIDPHAYENQIGGGHKHNGESRNLGHRNKFLSVSAIVAISAAVVILVGVVVISLLNISARRRLVFVDNALESMCSSSTRSGSLLATGKLVLFGRKVPPDWMSCSPESLLEKATEIGGGIFGTVYKATLGEGEGRRAVVAIKKLVTSNIIQYPSDFDREVRVLGKARHPNLVPLKGYYWTPQLQLLVSDFAPNGSLQARLHERPNSTPPLSWSARFKIVLGTAKGLAYLHHSCRPPIIHYNIKPSNILLDENFNPKISDFGLARLIKKLDKHVMTSRFQSSLGYLAPELACQSLRVNEKCDIYGFGVLILELVTGRRPVEYGEDNMVILSDHVRLTLEQGNVLECIDPEINEYPEEEVLPVLKLALVCTSQIPSSRPSMVEVVQILQVIETPVPQRMEPF